MWPIILNFDQATHVSLIQNKNYQQSPEKTKNNGVDNNNENNNNGEYERKY